MLKRNVPLPSNAPRTRRTGMRDDILSLAEGESGILAYAAPVVRSACKGIVANLAEVGESRAYIVWPSNSDGTAQETGSDFALIARLSDADARKYDAESPGCVIRLRDAA